VPVYSYFPVLYWPYHAISSITRVLKGMCGMDKIKLTGQNLAEFSSLEEAAFMLSAHDAVKQNGQT